MKPLGTPTPPLPSLLCPRVLEPSALIARRPLTLSCPSPGSSAYSPPDAFRVSIPIRNNYMYARVRKALPELYAFTACMWLRSRSGGSGQGTPFSYSVPGQANEIVLLEAGLEPMELLINDKVGSASQSTVPLTTSVLNVVDIFILLFTILTTH